MEQTNLVVTSDGKTWDEVTRDVSYIGNHGGYDVSSEILHANTHSGVMIWTLYRGGVDGVSGVDELYRANWTKDFAIAYDRLICLRSGNYFFGFGSHINGTQIYLKINGQKFQSLHHAGSDSSAIYGTAEAHLKRGDYVQRFGGHINNGDNEWSAMHCHRIGD